MAEKRRRKEKNFLIQGSILAFAGVITKIIGAVYRIPLMNIVGTEGMGYYNVAFSIYTIALMLTSYSLPLAVSKLVSARVAVGQYRNAYKVFRCALSIAVIASGIISLVIFFGAEFIAGTIMAMDMSVYALRVLAPCIFVVALLGVIRGFFQGNGSMMPTAFSQILEQIVNAAASVAGAYVLLKMGMEIAGTRGDDSYGAAYAAAGGKDIVLKSDGSQLRSYCYCLDCASAILKVLIKGENKQAYNICVPDSVISIKQLAEILAEAGGVKVVRGEADMIEKKGFNPMRNSSLDSTRLLALGWKNRFDAETGLAHTVKILNEIKTVVGDGMDE